MIPYPLSRSSRGTATGAVIMILLEVSESSIVAIYYRPLTPYTA